MMDTAPVNHRREVTGVVFLAFAIILGVSFYLPEAATGFIGDILRQTGKGLFGVCAYAIPLLCMYSALDFFWEKRVNVAPRRVQYVLLLLLAASAILPVITVNISILKTLSLDVTKNQSLASKGLEFLWKSGIQPSLLKGNTDHSSVILTGGVLGGSIALAMQILAARTGALILLSAFALSQIILIFNVSLSRTATRTVEAIRSTSQRASVAIRSGAESLRTYSRHSGMQPNKSDGMKDQDYLSGSSANVRGAAGNESSPFDEIDDDFHQGFIDLEGTDTPMSATSHRGAYNSFDVDLSRPAAQDLRLRNQPAEIPVDQYVETDFLRPASDPLPTSHAQAVSEIPGFLRPKEEATWLDIQTNIAGSTEPKYTHIPIQRIGTNGKVVLASEQDDFDDRVDSAFSEETDIPSRQTFNYTGATVPGASGHAQPQPSNAFAVTSNDPTGSKTTAQKSYQRQIPISFPKPVYKAAPTSLLRPDVKDETGRASQSALVAQGKKLEDTLLSFGVVAKVINITHGPAITRFELTPGP